MWPTPRASPNENRQTKRTPSQEAGRHGLCLAAEVCETHAMWPTPTVSQRPCEGNVRMLRAAWLEGLPLEEANAMAGKDVRDAQGKVPAMWPTPTLTGNYNRKGASKTAGDGISTAVAMWLTPSANEDAAGTPHGNMQKMLGNDPVIRSMDPQKWATGVLSPAWVEHLMGWPTGWTGLPPEAHGRMVAARRRLSGRSRARKRRATPNGNTD